MGKSYPGTRIGKTFAARGAEFQQSERRIRSQRRDVVDFGPAFVANYQVASVDLDDGPDLNNAVSTLVVRALPGGGSEDRPKYWARSVRVITLPEVFNHYKDEATFPLIYDTWLEGAVVIRNTPKRGKIAGSKRSKQRVT